MKKDRTATLLFIINTIIEKFPKYNYLRVEAWDTRNTRTLKIMIEVTMGDEKSSN